MDTLPSISKIYLSSKVANKKGPISSLAKANFKPSVNKFEPILASRNQSSGQLLHNQSS